MSKILLLALIACLPAFAPAQLPQKVPVASGLSAAEENALAAAKSSDWDPGPSVSIGRTHWTCSVLRSIAGDAGVDKGDLGLCTASTSGMRVQVKLPKNWRELPPTALLPYFERRHAAEVDPLLPRK